MCVKIDIGGDLLENLSGFAEFKRKKFDNK
jgi:hypothetical protein